jgi:hypothetical protein
MRLPFGLLPPSMLSQRWRDLGRNWAIQGQLARSEWCHEMADYWSLPIWKQIFGPKPSMTPPDLEKRS